MLIYLYIIKTNFKSEISGKNRKTQKFIEKNVTIW